MLKVRRYDAKRMFIQRYLFGQSIVIKERLSAGSAVHVSNLNKTMGMLEQRQITGMLADRNLKILLKP